MDHKASEVKGIHDVHRFYYVMSRS